MRYKLNTRGKKISVSMRGESSYRYWLSAIALVADSETGKGLTIKANTEGKKRSLEVICEDEDQQEAILEIIKGVLKNSEEDLPIHKYPKVDA